MVRVLFLNLVVFAIVSLLAKNIARASTSCTAEAAIDGAVSTATFDFVERAIKRASRNSCSSILFNINTPGGSLQTTRMIVEKILASPVPVLCLVGPEGGHAGSAGALILLACHISGVMPATNVGAATPISGDGASFGADLRKKIVEDTKSWAVSLAKKRGRSLKFAEQIVTEAKAYDGEQAVKDGGVDLLAKSKADFLAQARGRKVLMATTLESNGAAVNAVSSVSVETGVLVEIEKDWRERTLSFLADPEFSYLLFMAAIGLLYFELTHPGAIAPGVAGSLLLVTSLIAFQKLDVAWGGVGLMLLGMAFLVAEAFVPSFGALGIGGIVALGMGSVLLYDPASGGLGLSPWLALGVPLTLGFALLALAVWIFRTRRRNRGESLSETGIRGEFSRVERLDEGARSGTLVVRGEIWKFETPIPVAVGERVRIVEIEGLKLKVEKENT